MGATNHRSRFSLASMARSLLLLPASELLQNGYRIPVKNFMNFLLPRIVAALSLACALILKAGVSNGAEVGQTPAKMPPSLDGAIKAKA